MSSEIVIKVENLSKRYQIYEDPRDRLKQFIFPRIRRFFSLQQKEYFRGFWALNDVSFEVKKGETVGIIGRNGSGKSTLLQMICGTLHQSGGNLQVNGRIAALLELGSGFNPEFTGRENIYMNGTLLGLTHHEIDVRFDSIVAFSEIGQFIEQQVKTYSSGMLMRLAFAVSVSVDPDILVVDEALAVGDEAFQRKCYSKIEEIKRKGASILFVTHSTQTVIEMCDRVLLLNRGCLLFDGKPHKGVNYYYQLTGKKDLQIDPVLSESPLKMGGAAIEPHRASEINFHDERVAVLNLGLDNSLVSPTSHEVCNEEYCVQIKNIALVAEDHAPTNILLYLQRYQILFEVNFDRPLPNISYQVLFKTVNGLPISGNKFYYDDICADRFYGATRQRINYDFICNFNPGVYFISIEVCGGFGDENTVYHKFAEVLAFRVMAEYSTSIGYMSVIPSYKVEII
jgi:lipopolysaccharide transport system ATP-binding protein